MDSKIVVKTVGKGFGSGISSVLGTIFSFIKKRIFFVLTAISLTILCSSAIIESYEEKSFEPIIINIGGAIVSGDTIVKYETEKLIENGNSLIFYEHEGNEGWRFFLTIYKTAKTYSKILSAFWMMFVMFLFVYRLINWHNDSEKMWNIIFALVIYIMLMVGFCISTSYHSFIENQYSDNPMEKEEAIEKYKESFIPLSGTFKFGKYIYEQTTNEKYVEKVKEKYNVNQTNVTTI